MTLRAREFLSSKLLLLAERGLNYRDPSLLEAQPVPVEKSFEVSISLHSSGIFSRYLFLCILSVCVCVCESIQIM